MKQSTIIAFDSCTLWTDSTIVLGWLNASPSNLKVFVANRVPEIQGLTKGCSWRHVPTQDNPADILSRRISPKFLQYCDMWLLKPQSEWPRFDANLIDLPELKTHKIISLFAIDDDFHDFVFQRFSNLQKLKRVIAWCLRFIDNCRSSKNKNNNKHLQPAELEQSLSCLIRLAQAKEFSNAYGDLSTGKQLSEKSNLLQLAPFLDK